ncbi:MAG: FtsX-like permease family protein [Candidatus Omnitrophica bacterium]|nr:FtsX-like permease family protein [Candidatus Omnitrophota bacterium]
MAFEGFIARKHLMFRKKATLICILGVGVGVAALMVVLAVFTGFQSELKSTMVGVHPHLRIEKWGGLDDPQGDIAKVEALEIRGIRSLSSFVAAEAILQSNAGATGVIVRGVDPVHEDLEIFKRHMVAGKFDLSDQHWMETERRGLFFKKDLKKTIGCIMIGEGLARILHVQVGDRITLVAPSFGGNTESFNLGQARSEPFMVKGIFNVGMNEFDTSYVLLDLPRAQRLYALGGRVSGISIRFQDVDDALRWEWVIRGQLGLEYVVTTWQDVNPHFFQALKVEKSVQTIFLSLIVLVAALNIFSTLIMIVMAKTRDIGILRTLGATEMSVRRIFLWEGFTIGVVGVVLGALSGLTLLYYRNDVLDFIKKTTGFELFPSDVYLFDGLPAEIHPEDIAVIVVLALLASILAAVYPSHRAAKLHPAEALRYE